MAITLEKKKPISLVKEKPGLQKIVAGLGWDEATINGHKVDCDVSVFMLGSNGKIPQDEFFIFYNNLNSPDSAVKHLGDNRDGEGDGDDESVNIDLSRLDSRIEFLYFAVTINESEERGHHFGNVENSYINIRNGIDNSILCQYELKENFSGQDSLIIASISRNGGSWNVEALGQAFSGGLGTLIELYQ
ncbi:TerD family protein [Flavobacterium sp. K5-23]|uniref:TerD family protein n=1 Tax=Flavobacterium sp. K5-23 TaxID=2746225 RepID=UPI00200C33A0|nr:TerD family protein [Flavobacterium sp. K5-23]UQD57229.1 TerD family protein [Flavobacterium sp. K5-23]